MVEFKKKYMKQILADRKFKEIVLITTTSSSLAEAFFIAETGFYDGIIFHRVIPGFMAQTGDPLGNGTGGSGKNLKAEFSDYKFKYGTVGMARSMNPDSGDSQFFSCFDGCGHLTGQYTVWGQVETGMEVVEKIEIGEPPSNPDQIIEAFVGKKKTK